MKWPLLHRFFPFAGCVLLAWLLLGNAGAAHALEYRLGAGDVLDYQVYHQPEFAQTGILVRPDGQASFQGIGELPVGGKTLPQVSAQLKAALREWLVNPRVTVTVAKTRPATVYLTGAVMHPGMFQLSTHQTDQVQQDQPALKRLDMRLSNILANAGGVRWDADLHHVLIQREAAGTREEVDLWRMLTHGEQVGDVWLASGDSIHIPTLPPNALGDEDYKILLRSSVGPGSFPVRIIGQVNNPGLYELSANSPQLNSAVAKAGGYLGGALRQKIAIRRFDAAGNPRTLYVNPERADITLRPNDVVFVPETKTYITGRVFEQVGKVFLPFSTLATAGWGLAGTVGIGGFSR